MTSAHDQDDLRVFYNECVSLAGNGVDTYLVAKGESVDRDGVHIIGVGMAPQSRVKRMTLFANRVYRTALSLDADIYHIHDPELLPYGKKLKKHGKKVIFDSHEDILNQMTDKTWIPSVIRPLVSKVFRSYATRSFKKCDALISVTPHITDELKKINPNTWLITNYPILLPVAAEKHSDGFSICFTGGISEQWSHKEIIDSIACLDGVTYSLCGFAEEKYLNALQESKGWDKVRYLGRVSHEEALKIQTDSDAGMTVLKPSGNTGYMTGTLGNTKIFEYMMAGIPVVCTDFVLWKEIIDKWHCGICVPPNDTATITASVRYLRDNPEEARQMGKNGRKAVETEYNWKTQEEQLLRLYHTLSESK
jgi:glycosyltransferase involved in cell wall biosynthesis